MIDGNIRTYLPINSYGMIGDCHSAVLIAPDGAIDWGCLPDFDSPAIFCRLLEIVPPSFVVYWMQSEVDTSRSRLRIPPLLDHNTIYAVVMCFKLHLPAVQAKLC